MKGHLQRRAKQGIKSAAAPVANNLRTKRLLARLPRWQQNQTEQKTKSRRRGMHFNYAVSTLLKMRRLKRILRPRRAFSRQLASLMANFLRLSPEDSV